MNAKTWEEVEKIDREAYELSKEFQNKLANHEDLIDIIKKIDDFKNRTGRTCLYATYDN